MNNHFPLLETLFTVFPLVVFTNSGTGMFRFLGCLDSMVAMRFPVISLFICLAITVVSGSSGMVFTNQRVDEGLDCRLFKIDSKRKVEDVSVLDFGVCARLTFI